MALQSYGTLPDGEITDGALSSVLRFMEAQSVTDMKDVLGDMKVMGFSFIIGDTAGNIGWQTTGSSPNCCMPIVAFRLSTQPPGETGSGPRFDRETADP